LKVLLIHDFYQQFGGEDAVALSERKLLERYGHEVLFYTRHNDEIQTFGAAQKLWFGFDTLYSFRTSREIQEAVAKWRPDVAYIHNVYPLISPSVYHLLHSLGIPTVQCVHDFRPICPNGWFYTQGEICERCKGGNYLHAIRHRCYKDSYALSALYAATLSVNRLAHMIDKIGAFICLTEFYEQKLLEVGVPQEKIYIRPTSIDASAISPGDRALTADYAVYLGRLSPEKGLWTVVQAFEQAKAGRLKIIGTGPLEGELRQYIREKGLDNVEMVGFRSGEEKWELLRNALFAIIPSVCYENFPVVSLEYYAMAKPIVAANLGGLPYIIVDGETGLLFKPGDAADLAQKIRYLLSHHEEAARMGRRGRELAETKYGLDQSYQNLMNIFQQVQAA
jgi:glycosyltransferase involved in cell wall biosynthesis